MAQDLLAKRRWYERKICIEWIQILFVLADSMKVSAKTFAKMQKALGTLVGCHKSKYWQEIMAIRLVAGQYKMSFLAPICAMPFIDAE